MTKGEPKKKKSKKGVFTIYVRYNGLFTGGPLRYSQGDMKEMTDISFEGMSYENLVEILKRLFPRTYFYRLYYCKTNTPLKLGIKELKNDNDVSEMLKAGYENGNKMDIYLEHVDYDVLDLLEIEDKEQNVEDSDDSYSSDYCEEVDYVDFQNEADDVVIKDFSTKDPFLNNLFNDKGLFRTYVHRKVPVSQQEPEEDLEQNTIDPIYKVKKGVVYPTFNPDIPWNNMEPILGMRYEDSQQLKFALANYGVANGFQLWYMKNDWRSVLVYCGRNVDEGRCAGKKGDKDRLMPNEKKALKNDCGEGTSKGRKKKLKKKPVKKKVCVKNDCGEGTSKGGNKKISALKKGNCCPFRLYASWMSNEQSFQIKSLIPDHKCSRNYNLGALVNYKWIAGQYAKEIIADPNMPYRKMKDDIRVKFKIDVSLGQCKRAKQRALYDHEGGLIEHYSKLYEYRNAVLETNPGSTCRLDVDQSSNGNVLFKRMYICFKGVKDGWLAGCRKVIGLDGYFLKHTCRGELLTAMGRDANNQMYPIAWVVVRVENAENWGWFISLLHDDLALNDGHGITIISDSHKGLLDAVSDWLPHAEHRKCTRHLYANFKKKFTGVQYQRLFWTAASSTLEQQFEFYMEQIKQIDQRAYDYLIQRNPNSWSRAFFELDRKCAAFENGISESFNRAILGPRSKPIITMLEDIRLYIMQRLVAMNKKAFSLEDTITPSIKKRLNILQDQQRHWHVYPSGFQVLEVRKGDESYAVNLLHKVCSCKHWELCGVPCVHAVAGYMHLSKEPDEGVSHWYSQDKWFSAYQFSINPVWGSKTWKRTNDTPPLPPLVRKMPGRPQKARIKSPNENNGIQVNRVGRTMTCSNCWQKGHNKAGCKNAPQPKPQTVKRQPGRKRETGHGQCASRAGRGGIGSRCGRGGRGVSTSGSGRGEAASGNDSGVGTSGVGRGVGTSGSGRGEAASGNDSGVGTSGVGIVISMWDVTSDDHLTQEQRNQMALDEEIFREFMEEEAKKEQEIDEHGIEDMIEEEPYNRVIPQQLLLPNNPSHPTQESVIHVTQATSVVVTATSSRNETPKKKRNMNKWLQKAYVKGERIYHKNRGRSERIKNLQMSKAFQFDQVGTGSTPDQAFGVSDSE